MNQAAALAAMESQLVKRRAPTAGTCQAMRLPVVLSVIGLKVTKVADSDKATGHPKAAANLPLRRRRSPRRYYGFLATINPGFDNVVFGGNNDSPRVYSSTLVPVRVIFRTQLLSAWLR